MKTILVKRFYKWKRCNCGELRGHYAFGDVYGTPDRHVTREHWTTEKRELPKVLPEEMAMGMIDAIKAYRNRTGEGLALSLRMIRRAKARAAKTAKAVT